MILPFAPSRFSSPLRNEFAARGRKAFSSHYPAYFAAFASQSDGMRILSWLTWFGVQRLANSLLDDAEGAFHGVLVIA